MKEPRERKPSPAKAAVAMQKPRDAQGKFLSGAELEAYRAQQQQAQFAAERSKVNAILGRRESIPQNTTQPQQIIPQNNFQAILNANKPGTPDEQDRWNTLLGKKKNRW